MPTVDHQRLLIRAAQFYYLDELTQSEISQRLRLSRQKVQRLIHEARELGIVQIAIRPVMGIFSELEHNLEERFHLREALVVETTAYQDQSIVAREVGAGAANYLLRIVQPHDRIVISWGGTLLGMVNALAAHSDRFDFDELQVIQGLGGLGDPNHEAHAADLARRLAKFLGGSAQLLPAPGIAGSRRARQALYQDPHVSHVLQNARRATLALIGIGAPRADSILVNAGTLVRWPELQKLQQRGAVGDMNLRYFDAAGHQVASELDERVIGLTLAEIQGLTHVVGLAGGAAKFDAIRGALEGNLVHALVTDHVTAQRLLESNAKTFQAKPRQRANGRP
jgi:DNA-binding transcriptional regulator LsrR (DeoR family)